MKLQKAKTLTKAWRLSDVIMIGILGVIFALVYLGAFYISQAIGIGLTPFGLAPLNFEFVYGVWFMAATLAAFIMQKPGVAFVTEVLAAFLELLMGNFPIVITTGVIQGAGSELGFAVFGYKKYTLLSMCVSAAFACILSFIWTYFVNGYQTLETSLLLVMFCIRMATSLLFAGVISWLIGKGLARTGVLKGYALGMKVQYKDIAEEDE